MKTVIAPEYKSTEALINRAMEGEVSPVAILRDKTRNYVYLIQEDGHRWIVKRYGRPNIINRFAYGLFRSSKARRAYENALKLTGYGVMTARPIAYADFKHHGLNEGGCFISEFINAPLLFDLYDLQWSADEKKLICEDLARFTYNLHSKGIYPHDYNPGNLFYIKQTDGHYTFAIIDINRMKFGHVPDIRQAMASFSQLGLCDAECDMVLSVYAPLRGFSVEECKRLLLDHRRRYYRKKERIRRLKNLIRG